MAQKVYSTAQSNPYDVLLKDAPTFERIPIEQIVTHSLGERFVQDGKSLEATANEQDYIRLKVGLVDYLKNFRSGQSYGSVALNEIGDNFLCILEYIALIDKKFNTDPKRVEGLRLAVIKTFREKVDSGAWRFIPVVYMGLYKRAEAELENSKTR